MVEALHALGLGLGAVETKWPDVTTRMVAGIQGLVEHVLPARQPQGTRIAKAAHPAKATELMIERSVFLHEDDNVLDVTKRSGLTASGQRQSGLDGRERIADGQRSAQLQQVPPPGRDDQLKPLR
jgi:hypothetical protein